MGSLALPGSSISFYFMLHNLHKVLVKDTDIKERWKEYFDKFFNGTYIQDVGDVNIQPEDLNHDFMCRIRPCEVKKALR